MSDSDKRGDGLGIDKGVSEVGPILRDREQSGPTSAWQITAD